MTVVFEGNVFADYHQFYLADDVSPRDMPSDWSDDDVRRRVVCGDGVLVVSTARNMDVPVRIELHESAPELPGEADHIVVAHLRAGGTIAIAGCTDYFPDAARFKTPSGDLKVALVFSGLGSLSEDGLEGDDRYVVHLWPGEKQDVLVLRQWDGEQA